jgi:two-component system response regulator NreC
MNIEPTPGHPANASSFEEEILTSLMQRLVRLVGAPLAVSLVRHIPLLVVDLYGHVLDYDRNDARGTARLLIEVYDNVSGQIAAYVSQPVASDQSAANEAGGALAPAEPEPPAVRILIVDDHALVGEGLVSLIDPLPDMRVVGQAGSVREAIHLAEQLRPDLILMDFTLPDGTGDEAARAIRARLPNVRIVFLTVHDDDDRLHAAIAAGASGYLLKSVRSADLVHRLRAVVRGDVALSPLIARRLFESYAPPPAGRPRAPTSSALDALTGREVEVLRRLAQGHTNREIAAALNLSIRTVEYHRANVMSKLGLRSRADLVRHAAERGLLHTSDASPPTRH